MQAELARVARLTTMGQMAASIAHEINQPLAGVVNNANAGHAGSIRNRRMSRRWTQPYGVL
jgi:C4-dicarboxylate-specific signal transduction histidine kinase